MTPAEMMYPGLKPGRCPQCNDVGVLTDEDGDQRICGIEGCKGAERTLEEAQRLVGLLDSVDDYQAALLGGVNKVVLNRVRNHMFDTVKLYKKTLK